MKNLFQFDIKFIIILILAGILLLKNCVETKVDDKEIYRIGNKKYELIKFKIDTITNYRNKIVMVKGDDMYIDTIKHDTIFAEKIDTLSIIQDYFTKYVYKDSLTLDSVGYVKTVDTIYKNRLVNRKYDYNVKERVITKEVIVNEPPKRQVYAGFNTTINKIDIFNSVSGGLIYKDKKDKIYQFNIGLGKTQNTSITPYIGGGLYWKLRIKKD